MNQLLPRKPDVEVSNEDSLVLGLADQETNSVFSVLSSELARSILDQLYESPATQSELAAYEDTSIQNVSYHLENLVEAGLVEVVDQWYSEKGREMDVYAPAGDSLVLIAGNARQVDEVRQMTPMEHPQKVSD
ncbi:MULTISPECIES: ArsR/SmtB family transcription factor [Salinibaculum]|uniref:ArsR/SmtB family transcription factor n=1 Tax=Salinibaculum TaxID=2732368 RepID=UPI0030D29235